MPEITLADLTRPSVMVSCRLAPLTIVELDRVAAARGVTRADLLRDAVLLLLGGADDRAPGAGPAGGLPPAPGQPASIPGGSSCPAPVA